MPERITPLEAAKNECVQLRLALAQMELRALTAEVFAAHGLRPGIDAINPDGTITRAEKDEP